MGVGDGELGVGLDQKSADRVGVCGVCARPQGVG